MSGSWAAQPPHGVVQPSAVGRVAGDDHGLEPGRRELPDAVRRVPAAELVPDLGVGEAGHPRDVARDSGALGRGGTGREGRDPLRAGADRHDRAVTPAMVAVDVVTRGQPSGADPDERRRVTGRVGLDLEHRGVQRFVGGAAGRRQVRGEGAEQVADARPRQRRTEEDRVGPSRCGGAGERVEQVALGRRSRPLGVRAQDVVVEHRQPVGELLDQLRTVPRRDRCGSGPGPHRRRERHRVADEGVTEGGHGPFRRGAAPVDLVREHQERDAEPLHDPDQRAGLGLDALDGRDDEHRTVEHPQGTLDLGHEVGVAGGVDEVDLEVTHGERDDGRADGDAAATFDVVGVGHGVAVVDAAEVGADARLVEQALGQRGLAGVDVGDDPEVEGGLHGVTAFEGWRRGRWARCFLISGLLPAVVPAVGTATTLGTRVPRARRNISRPGANGRPAAAGTTRRARGRRRRARRPRRARTRARRRRGCSRAGSPRSSRRGRGTPR